MRNKCVPNSYSIHIGVTTGKGGKIQPTIQQTNTSKDWFILINSINRDNEQQTE